MTKKLLGLGPVDPMSAMREAIKEEFRKVEEQLLTIMCPAQNLIDDIVREAIEDPAGLSDCTIKFLEGVRQDMRDADLKSCLTSGLASLSQSTKESETAICVAGRLAKK